MEQDQAPIVTVPRSEAEGSVGRQIREQWAILKEWLSHGSALTTRQIEAIRKLDALIGHER